MISPINSKPTALSLAPLTLAQCRRPMTPKLEQQKETIKQSRSVADKLHHYYTFPYRVIPKSLEKKINNQMPLDSKTMLPFTRSNTYASTVNLLSLLIKLQICGSR